MSASAWALGCVICLVYIIWHVVKYEQERKRNNYVPGPLNFPILGSGLQVLFRICTTWSGVHFQRFQKLMENRGRVVGVSCFAFTVVFTQDLEYVREVLNSPDWSYRFPDHPRFKEHTLFQNLGIMFSDGEVHREMRKFVVKTLRNFGFGELKACDELIQVEIDDLLKIFEEERKSGTDFENEVFIHHKLKVPTFNVLWRVMAGERFNHNDSKIVALIHAVEDCAKINIGLDPEWAFPILRFIPGCSPSRAKRQSFVICHEFFIDLLNERRLKGTYNSVQNDFIDYFLHKIDTEKGNPGTFYTDEQFQVTCVDLLFGGIDTTSNSLEFAILYMAKFPWVQRKAQAEIDAIVGKDRAPSISDRSQLKYVEAVMLETFRWACIVPMNLRTANCDTKVGGYNVRKGTSCGLNTTVVHWSKEVWGDPENFRPERFLNENNEIINSDKIFPFGGGKRLCPGNLMAKVIWMSFFTSMLQRYTFSPSPIRPKLKTFPNAAIANTPKPFHCIVTPR